MIEKQKKWIAASSQILFLTLFSYSGLSKALHFQSFYWDVSSSPLFRPEEAGIIARAVVSIELLVPLMICFDKTRGIGLYLALFMMVGFSTYLIVLFFFFDSRPCGCGGVFGSLDYPTHIILDLAIIFVAIVGCLTSESSLPAKRIV
jgi:hypothetical protein